MSKILTWISWIFMFAAPGSIIVCGAIGASWKRDREILRKTVDAVLGEAALDQNAVARLNDWVYRNQGFRKNHKFFLFPKLGPTPIQVLRGGGDCADKSRLLSALLKTKGMRSGLVMLHPGPDCSPNHTVVEIRTSRFEMIADPIWNVDYRMGWRALAASNHAEERVAQFRIARRMDQKLKLMPARDADFRYAKAFNFEANRLTRTLATLLTAMGIDPAELMRPTILEDPKLFVSVSAGCAAIVFALLRAATHMAARAKLPPVASSEKLAPTQWIAEPEIPNRPKESRAAQSLEAQLQAAEILLVAATGVQNSGSRPH